MKSLQDSIVNSQNIGKKFDGRNIPTETLKTFRDVHEGETIFYVNQKTGAVQPFIVANLALDNRAHSNNGARTLTLREEDLEFENELYIKPEGLGLSNLPAEEPYGFWITEVKVIGTNFNFGRYWE